MPVRIRPFAFVDYPDVLPCWRRCDGEGVVVGSADEPEAIRVFLERNPGLSFVARTEADTCVGSLLAGHDGRCGYLHHLAVDEAWRRQGLGRRLVDAALAALAAAGINRCHLLAFADNRIGVAFWEAVGWRCRDDLVVCTKGFGCQEREICG